MKRHSIIFLLVLFFSTISASAYALSYTGADITLLGTAVSGSSGIDPDNTPASGEKKWYSTTEGALWTAWAGLWVEYTVTLDSGNWNMGLNLTNHGNLGDGDWYGQFEIFNDFTKELITVPASDDETNFGFINVDIWSPVSSPVSYTVRYTWKNDKYAPDDGLDANIQIDSVFFDNTETAPVPEPATMFLLGIGLFGIAGLKRRKQ